MSHSNEPTPTIVNGKPVKGPHTLAEFGNKAYLLEISEWRGTTRLSIFQIWEPKDSPGQLMRGRNPTIVPMDEIDAFLAALSEVLGAEIVALSPEQEQDQ